MPNSVQCDHINLRIMFACWTFKNNNENSLKENCIDICSYWKSLGGQLS